MSEELKPCPFCGNDTVHVHDSYCAGSGFMVLCANCTAEGPLSNTESEAESEWNRRTAPVSAPLDTQALPPLPKPDSKGWIFTSSQLSQYAREAIAPYAERIRHLERELAERMAGQEAAVQTAAGSAETRMDTGFKGAAGLGQKPASIGDDPKFCERVEWWAGAAHSCDKHTRTVRAKAEWAALIAYIDGRTAGTAPKGCKIVPAEPTQAMCDAARAEAMGWQNSGEHWSAMTWFRIYKRMLAAAPSPLSKQEEANEN
jgi:Lar family restriction alleviation protein